jgi:hypothetical protein
MNRHRENCHTCNKHFVNLKTHQRKNHDVFTFITQDDIWRLYNNDDVFAEFKFLVGGGEGGYADIYDSREDFAFADDYYNMLMFPDNTFEVKNKRGTIIIARRAIVIRPEN